MNHHNKDPIFDKNAAIFFGTEPQKSPTKKTLTREERLSNFIGH